MSSAEIDSYLEGVSESQRSTLQDLRKVILRCVPQAEECTSYQVPAFRVNGSVVAGFAAFKNHMSYLPFSGSVLPALKRSLKNFDHTKSALHFTSTKTLSDELVALLVQTRLDEILAHHR